MVQKHRVDSAEDALGYITDCNLATVCRMAMQKSKSKSQFERHIEIAQSGVDWIVKFNVPYESYAGTRVEDVIKAGSVAKWAETFKQK